MEEDFEKEGKSENVKLRKKINKFWVLVTRESTREGKRRKGIESEKKGNQIFLIEF